MTFELQLVLLLICLIGTFIFAGTETGFVSWNRLKVSHLAERGVQHGKWGLFLIKNKAGLLSGVLIGSNVCIIGASLFFNNLYSSLSNFPLLSKIPSPESWILTPVIVLFCEMLPKSLFRIYSFELTMKFIPLLLITYFISLPVSFLISLFTGASRKSNINEEQSFKTKSREEMILVAAEGVRTGVLFESANYLFDNILNLKNRTICELMQSLSGYQKEILRLNDLISLVKEYKFNENEIIIYDESGRKPVGFINLLGIVMQNQDSALSDFVRPILVLDRDISLGASLKAAVSYQGNLILLKDKSDCIVGVVKKKELFSTIFCGNSVVSDELKVLQPVS